VTVQIWIKVDFRKRNIYCFVYCVFPKYLWNNSRFCVRQMR